MKGIWINTMLSLFGFLLPAILSAQTGLKVAPYFDGRYNKSRQVVTLLVKGKPLKSYNLTLYRSMTFDNGMSVLEDIEQAVLYDSHKAVDKETGYKNGKLLYGFYCFKSPAGKKEPLLRYLFFRRNERNTFLIYMEGRASLEDLKSMFKNKN